MSARASLGAAAPHVRFAPIATEVLRRREPPLCADIVAKVANCPVLIFLL